MLLCFMVWLGPETADVARFMGRVGKVTESRCQGECCGIQHGASLRLEEGSYPTELKPERFMYMEVSGWVGGEEQKVNEVHY